MEPKLINRKLRGLTLIETVVAVGLLSSVGTLLVPTLGTAREDAKRLTCMSRLGQVNRALLSYHADLNTLPLFTIIDPNGNTIGWTTWSYGGWSGKNRPHWEEYAGGFANIQTNERPLSVYMTPWKIPEQVDPYTPTQEMPVFQCPADNISAEWQWGSSDQIPGISAYDDVGTSYAFNHAWWDQVQQQEVPPGEDPWSYYVSVYGAQIFDKYMARDTADTAGGRRSEPTEVASSNAPRAGKRKSSWSADGPSRFITLMEDPAFYGLAAGGLSYAGIQMPGYHGEFSTHVVAFADGGVEYTYMDTRHLHDSAPNPPGPRHYRYEPIGNWTACDQSKEHADGSRHHN